MLSWPSSQRMRYRGDGSPRNTYREITTTPDEQKRASKIPASTTARRMLPRHAKAQGRPPSMVGDEWAGRSEHFTVHNSDQRDADRRTRIRAAVGARPCRRLSMIFR